MALSTFQDPFGIDWPLGFVAVPTIGTPVNIMHNVDANNNNAPGTTANTNTAEYTPTCRKIVFQGVKPGSANNGMVANAGQIYILRSVGPGSSNNNSGGPANRTDSGAMLYVLASNQSVTIPLDEQDHGTISPYRYSIDGDNNNDGCLITLIGCARG